ncbi:class I SAM-dependent methyltransferase [Opitutales bacterium]|nr:class I SAM-dependent methyltransferase [Opitutales bacterium]
MNEKNLHVVVIEEDFTLAVGGKENFKHKVIPWEIHSHFNELEKVELRGCLEKMTSMESDLCLFQVHNSLKIGGSIEITTLDTDYFASLWLKAKWDGDSLKDHTSAAQRSFAAFNGQQETGNPLKENYDNSYSCINKSSYNEQRLELLLGRSGFSQIRIYSEEPGYLRAEAKKMMVAGERQVAPNLSLIRKDHLARYKFAAEKINSREKILDFACGTGYGSFLLAKSCNGSEVTACDISVEALDYARTNYFNQNVKYLQNDCNKPTICFESYDSAISFETIEHLENPKVFLNSLCQSLCSGGKIFISCPNQDVEPFDKSKYPFHFKHYTQSQMQKLLLEAGFENISFYTQKDSLNCEIKQGTDGKYIIATANKGRRAKTIPSIHKN